MSKNAQILLENLIEQEFRNNDNYSNISEYFEFFSASQILKNQGLSDDEVDNGIVGKGLDGGCDSIYLFLNNLLITPDVVEHISAPKDSILEMIIIQSKKTTSFGEDAVMKWKTISGNLLDLSKTTTDFTARYNADILEAFTTFRDTYTRLITSRVKLKFRFYYATLASELHPNVIQQAEELKDTIKGLFPNAVVEVTFVDSDTLFEMYNAVIENRVNLKFADIPISPNQKNYVALVDLKSYFNFIVNDEGDVRKSFFDSNVRDYQGKNNVNSSISETLHRADDNDFWWLNNGVTVLASEATLVNNRELQIVNPEIVNGLQTSMEIYNYFSENREALESEKRSILLRIIVPDNEESRDQIIFATNNQTNIPKATLRVTDPIHLQIEMYFKSRGLFYDRRKNYYKNQGHKPAEIVGVSFLAQCLITIFLKKPDYARARPSTLLNDEKTYNELYEKNNDLEVFYRVALLGKKIQKNVRSGSDYSSAEKSDILYYVLYAVIADVLGKKNITPADIKNLDMDSVTDTLIEDIRNRVYEIYKQHGGNGRVAKSAEFIQYIDNMLDE
ncbi:abortive phage resistance protein [Coprobacillus sp. AF18-15LB]|nr:abortive infection phage resistance protein [Coprobacillus sp. 8_1_38FAA]RGT58990.1 abortive phage resistance protein [Coprobacillus sp. AF18-40]RGT82888.1 abortive phage resistance protein [Coprobacillus sp. AF18-15LB]